MFHRRSRRRSYRPRRYSRRRRYYPSPLRTQMNDSETRTMSFTQNIDISLTIDANDHGIAAFLPLGNILSGNVSSQIVTAGRIFHAGMMYDRLRVKSCSVQVRPKMMPASNGVTNYTFYLAWDRYYQDISAAELGADRTIVTDDPSAKVIVWSPGGNASTISHYVYSLPKDRYQYLRISHHHTGNPYGWSVQSDDSSFQPTLRYVLDIGTPTTAPLSVSLVFQYRFTLEFMGATSFGSPTLNRSSSSRFQPASDPYSSTPVDSSASGQPRLVPPN